MTARVFDLSFRYKIPLWGSALIAVVALLMTLSFMLQSYEDLKRDMLAHSDSLGHVLIKTLYAPMLHDDVWRAFEIVQAPYSEGAPAGSFRAEGMILIDSLHEVFVSSQPDAWPMRSPVSRLGAVYARLDDTLKATPEGMTVLVEDDDTILLALPMIADEVGIGHLVLVHPTGFYWPRFRELAWRALIISTLVLSVLLPINWYWGRRMAMPVQRLAERMDALGRHDPAESLSHDYPYRDELGRLFQAYDRMHAEMAEKASLEQRMVKADRLAALGRLAAGIAHEINNPLGGLMTSLDTVKLHAAPDPVLDRFLPYLERGLAQIRDIVGALLVETKARSRPLYPQDIDDVRTLLTQEAKQREVDWLWDNRAGDASGQPATLVRQVLINLVLNALQAAGAGGHVSVSCIGSEAGLKLEIENDGAMIPPELMKHLFEPFTGMNEEGHGLGLWVTHQIVEQLGGVIGVDSRDGRTRFTVELPKGDCPWPPNASA
ncbi:MAG: ATP-binding protein [Pseudomonadota bacterium]